MSLKGWSETIQKIGEQSRHDQEERVERLWQELHEALRTLHTMSNETLVEWAYEQPRGSGFDVKENEVWQSLHRAIKKELLRRLSTAEAGMT